VKQTQRLAMSEGQASMPLEILHFAFVLFGRGTRRECAEIAAFAGFAVLLALLQPVFTTLEFADHFDTS